MSGALIMGVSRALYEEVAFDKGRVTSLDWVTYPLLRFKDQPDGDDGGRAAARTCSRPARASRRPPPSAAAIANAFFDATGVRLHEAPMTPARVRATLKAAGLQRRPMRVVGVGRASGDRARLFARMPLVERSASRATSRAPTCCRSRSSPTAPQTALARDGKTILSYGAGAGYTPLRELIGAVVRRASRPTSCSRTARSRGWPARRRSCAAAGGASSTRATRGTRHGAARGRRRR